MIAQCGRQKGVDRAIWRAFGEFAQFRDGFEDSAEYEDARTQFRMCLPEGGFGVALSQCKTAAAFFKREKTVYCDKRTFFVGMSTGFAFASTTDPQAE